MRLIDADALYELLDGGYDLDFDEVPETKRELLRMISEQPTIEERKKGEWRTTLYHISDDGNELYEHYCSECKKTVMISNLKKGRFKYCPNCGADMRGGDDEES